MGSRSLNRRSIRVATLAAMIAVAGPGCGRGRPEAAPASDTRAPAIELVSPARGQMVPAGTPIHVVGRARDEAGGSGLRSVRIGGRPVQAGGDGTFGARLEAAPGMNHVRIEAEDRAGNRAVETVACLAGTFVPEGHLLRPGAAARLDCAALDRLEAKCAAALPGVSTVDLEPRAGALHVSTTVRDLRVEADLVASADPFGCFRLQAKEPPRFGRRVLDLERRAIGRQVEHAVGGAIAAALEEICAPQARQLGGGAVITMVFHPERVIHDAGGIGIELATLLSGPRFPFVPDAPGSCAPARALALPAAPGQILVVSDGFFNQVLFTLWRAGSLSLPLTGPTLREIDPDVVLDSDLVRLHLPSLRDRVPAGRPASIRLDALIPPVLAATHIELADLGISIVVDGTTVVRGFAQIRLPAAIVAKGTLLMLDLDVERAEASADVTASPLAPVPDAELAAFVRAVLPPVLAAGAARIQGVRVPAPSFLVE